MDKIRQNSNPIYGLLGIVESLIEQCKRSQKKIKAEVTQQMMVIGNGNYASQGDININILNQEVLIGLHDIKDRLKQILNDSRFLFSDTLNLKELEKQAYIKAIEATSGNQLKASKLLGITARTIRNNREHFLWPS